MNVTLTIDMDKRCAECGKPGAMNGGLCLRCATAAMSGKAMRSPAGRAVQRRFADANPRRTKMAGENVEDSQ